ncbi:MAG: serine hydrolase domain-containing protein [Caulobacter sp.]|nr:serine hydrolase domain-containing protein [Caulobacter sp.]
MLKATLSRISRRSLLAAPAVILAGSPALAWAQETPAERARAVVRELMTRAPIPAASAAVWRQGGLVWSEAFGVADPALATPASPHSAFRLASVSKVVTAAAAMRLAERRVVDLDAPISRYRRDLPVIHRQTTLRQLLSHQGGVRHYIGRDLDPAAPGGPIDRRVYRTTADKLAIFINDPLVSPPGQAFNYSTFGYTLISAVLESATGRAFPDILAAEVCDPLALGSVEPEIQGVLPPDRVGDFQPVRPPTPLGPAIVRCPAINPAYKWAGGGLIGAAPDIARFAGALSHPGFLGQASLTELFTPRPPRNAAAVQSGIGWRMDRDGQGRRRAHHVGSIVGGRSIALLLPEAGLSVAILTNLGEVDFDPLAPAQRIAEAFLA